MIREKIIKLLGGYTEDTVKTMQEVIDCNVNLLKEQSKNTFTVSSFRRMEDIPFSPDYRSDEELKNEMWNEITEQLKKQVDIKKYKTEGAYAYRPKFIAITSIKGEERRRVFCEIDFSEFEERTEEVFINAMERRKHET